MPQAMTVPWLARLGWPWPPGVIDTVWTVFALANLDFIFMFPGWETIPFHAIWASMTLVYGFRVWKVGPTLWLMTAVKLLTAAGIAVDVWVGSEPRATSWPMAAAVVAMTTPSTTSVGRGAQVRNPYTSVKLIQMKW